MKVKCPKCGYEFEVKSSFDLKSVVEDKAIATVKDRYMPFNFSLTPLDFSLDKVLYSGPYKEVHLSCGHTFRCEFSQYARGQKAYCHICKKEVKVVKIVDTVTGKEYERL